MPPDGVQKRICQPPLVTGPRGPEIPGIFVIERLNRLPDDADYRTHWERGDDGAIAEYELAMIRRSAANMRALGLFAKRGD